MSNKERANKKRSKSKGAGKKQELAVSKKRLTAASAAAKEEVPTEAIKRAEQHAASQKEQPSSKRAEQQTASHIADQAPSKRTEQQTPSKSAGYSEETYRKLNDACAKSKHLAGRLSQQRAGLQLSLPAALPSALIFRALNKEADRYQELRSNRIAASDGQLELLVDGMRGDQLTKLIEELDELIGDFTGRN